MKTFIILSVALAALSGCKNQMSLGELRDAKWDSLAPGIDYISTGHSGSVLRNDDSIQFTFLGTSGSRGYLATVSIDTMIPEVSSVLNPIVTYHATQSSAGYLRVSISKMMLNNLEIIAYVASEQHDTDYERISADSAKLIRMPGIRSVKYISKEKAKKIYSEAGNDTLEWETVLEANPLPACFDITLEPRSWTEQELTTLRTSITENVLGITDVAYPRLAFEGQDKYNYFKYKRVRR